MGNGDYLIREVQGDAVPCEGPGLPRASFEDGIWKLVGSAEDRKGKNDVSANKHKYLGEMHRGELTPHEKPFVRLYGAMKGQTSLVGSLAEERGHKTGREPE